MYIGLNWNCCFPNVTFMLLVLLLPDIHPTLALKLTSSKSKPATIAGVDNSNSKATIFFGII